MKPATAEDWSKVKEITRMCEAGIGSFSNDDVSLLLCVVEELRNRIGLDDEGNLIGPYAHLPVTVKAVGTGERKEAPDVRQA